MTPVRDLHATCQHRKYLLTCDDFESEVPDPRSNPMTTIDYESRITDEIVREFQRAGNAIWEAHTPNTAGVGDVPERAVRAGLAAALAKLDAEETRSPRGRRSAR